MAEALSSLRFEGRIVGGMGLYSNMEIPGRGKLSNAPAGWPDVLQPGSLNVFIEIYPEGFRPPVGRSEGAYRLDNQNLPCAFMIPGDQITQNKLIYQGGPSPAQVWRARIEVLDKGLSIDCWVLRRLGSNAGYNNQGGNVLEIVSDKHLRTEYGLEEDGHRVALTLLAG